MSERVSLFNPIYYVNGKPHLGHAYTTVATDAVARYWRSRGKDVYFQVGTDEHGAKNAEKAEEAGQTPQEFVDEMSATFRLAWDRLSITNDTFWRTSSKEHKDRARAIFQQLYDGGFLYEDEYTGLYCTGCEKFITEKELDEEGNCPDHKKKPEELSEKNWFFKLSDFLPRVQALIESDELLVRPAHMKSEVLGLFKQGMDDFSVSRQRVTWGVPLPFAEDQVSYVWVEALFNYITGLGYGSNNDEAFTKYWPGVNVVGKDIIKFHAVYWPALLLALGIDPPRQVFAHGFFTVDGQKMSKTIGNVVDPNELVDRYGSDGARYLILSQFPFGQDGDVKAGQFDEQYNAALANDLGNLVHRVTSMAEKYLEGSVRADALVGDAILLPLVKELDAKIEDAFTAFRPDLALESVFALVERANALIEEREPWKLAKDEANRQALEALFADLLGGLQALAVFSYPFFPEASAKIADRIGLGLSEQGETSASAVFTVRTEEPLFPRIESE
ncbi:MAG: methionine--tRNA ligase [Candidatus Doudnabacteria bacterium]|nr:methionine--tRNA ligase [Candidatus Doudnabacteria bacterium]